MQRDQKQLRITTKKHIKEKSVLLWTQKDTDELLAHGSSSIFRVQGKVGHIIGFMWYVKITSLINVELYVNVWPPLAYGDQVLLSANDTFLIIWTKPGGTLK